MHLYEPEIYTYISVVNKGIACNSNPNYSGRTKDYGEMTKLMVM